MVAFLRPVIHLGILAFKHNTNKQELLNCFQHYKMLCNKTIVSEDCQQNVGNILDLLKLRHHNCTAFSYEEIQWMLTDLCTKYSYYIFV